MMKKLHTKLAVTAMLLMLVITMLVGVVYAATDTSYTVIINSNAYCTVKLLVDDAEVLPVSGSTNEYSVPSTSSNIKLQVTPFTGYEIREAIGDQLGGLKKENADGSVSYPDFEMDEANGGTECAVLLNSTSTTFTVTCSPRTYTIKVKPAQDGNHEWPAGTQNPQGQTYEYSADPSQCVTLDIPSKAGYVFNGWMVLPSESATEGTLLPYTVGETTVKLSRNTTPTSGGTLYLMPDWTPEQYAVYRQDREEGTDLLLSQDQHGLSWMENVNTSVNGSMGPDAEYPGYYPFSQYNTSEFFSPNISVQFTPDSNPYRNTVTRYYKPITYTIRYEDMVDDSAYPKAYTYNVAIGSEKFPTPVKIGYDFAGWRVFINVGTDTETGEAILRDVSDEFNTQNLSLDARKSCLAVDNVGHEIVIQAVWTPQKFPVNVYHTSADQAVPDLPLEYVYDGTLTVPTPTKTGYHFIGWTLIYNGESTDWDYVDADLILGDDAEERYTGEVKLVARWQAKTYTVEVKDTDGETTLSTFDAIFDAPFSQNKATVAIPQKEGHTFLGYYYGNDQSTLWIDADGNVSDALWTVDAEGTVALQALWQANPYDITLNVDSNLASIVFYDPATNTTYEYRGEPITGILYGTTLQVTVTALPDGYKVTVWNGIALDTHTARYQTNYTVGISNSISVSVLPMVADPQFKVDYIKEVITTESGTLPAGKYTVKYGDDEAREISIGTNMSDLMSISAYLGKPLTVIVRGESGVSADRVIEIPALAVRPVAPTVNTGDRYWIESIQRWYNSDLKQNGIRVKFVMEYVFADSYTWDSFEFKWVCEDGETVMDWTNIAIVPDPTDGRYGIVYLTDLAYGTKYTVYVRLKATEDAPHGEEYVNEPIVTESDAYVKIQIEKLEAMKVGAGEETVKHLQFYIDKIKQMADEGETELQAKVDEAIAKATVGAELELAKEKDKQIELLNAAFEKLKNSGWFLLEIGANGTETLGEKLILLDSIRDNAVASIIAITDTDQIANLSVITSSAIKQMEVVKIDRLQNDVAGKDSGEHTLVFENGLPQGSKWYVSSGDYTKLIAAVDSSIRNNFNFDQSGIITKEELASLVLKAYYYMSLEQPDNLANEEGTYTFTIVLPAHLLGESGLQVAYYNEGSGNLTVLKTERFGENGEYLRVTSTQSGIKNFVILGDDQVNLLGFIAALSAILLCQLIAIIVLWVRRAKYAKRVRNYSLMLPALLTVRFLPEGGLVAVVVLGGLVLLFQIVLMYLLLSSEMVYRKKEKRQKRGANEEQPAVPAMAEQEEPIEATSEQAYVEDVYAEETYSEEAYEEGYASDEEGYEAEEPTTEEYIDEDGEAFYTEDTEAQEDPYDFIEPAANPRYSLPDEELYVDPETGEVYSAEEMYGEQTEDTAYTDEAYAEDEAYVEDEAYAEDGSYVEDAEDESYVEEEAFSEDETYAENEAAYTEDDGEATVAWQPEPSPDPEEEQLYDDDPYTAYGEDEETNKKQS